jgi:hypothetical protein
MRQPEAGGLGEVLMKTAKTVASVCFLDNHSISMDVEQVGSIEMGTPMQVEDGTWFCEMIIRSANGTLAVQMLADNPERFVVSEQGEDREED